MLVIAPKAEGAEQNIWSYLLDPIQFLLRSGQQRVLLYKSGIIR